MKLKLRVRSQYFLRSLRRQKEKLAPTPNHWGDNFHPLLYDPFHLRDDLIYLLPRPTPVSGNLANAEPKTFEIWIDSKRAQYAMLCTASVRMYLEGSEQQGYVEELARMDAETKKRTRTWNLVHES